MSAFKPNSNDYRPDRVPSTTDMMPGLNPPAIANSKRPRRMRSAQGAAHYGNGHNGKKGPGATKPKTEYHDRKNAAPIFLQKTYEMISTCEPSIASWTPDGTMFVIKNQDVFSEKVIPKFFDHNKFTSFARQLNFYGFRKMQTRAIYKDDKVNDNPKHVTFFNEKFQRGKKHMLKEISRSTKGGNSSQNQHEMQKEINFLKKQLASLNQTISFMQTDYANRFATLETQVQTFFSYSSQQQPTPYPTSGNQSHVHFSNNPNPNYPDETSTNIEPINIHGHEDIPNKTNSNNHQRATLPPHPDAKNLPTNAKMPPPPPLNGGASQPGGPPKRMDSFLRGFSNTSLLGDTLQDMAPFEKKLFQNVMNNPDPIIIDMEPTSLTTQPDSIESKPDPPSRPSVTRQLSQSLVNLDLNEFPPLTNV